MSTIKFGTSGWRALYHEDFTFQNVGRVLQAVAEEVLREGKAGAAVVVGYDVRFMGREFAELAAAILAGNGLRVELTSRDVPTPCLSFTIIDRQLAGGVNFTASHNPFPYNGIKYSPASGGPALPETTRRIEARIVELQAGGAVKKIDLEAAAAKGLYSIIDPKPAYLKALAARVEAPLFGKLHGKRIAVDCKHAVARGYLDEFLVDHGVAVHVLHGDGDPYFGREHPEPSAGHVDVLQAYVREHADVVLGLACDGDADRFGIVDADGAFVEANLVASLLLDYLVQSRGWKGGVARSVATTHLIDRVAKHHGLALYETPVGFKYIGDLLVKGAIDFGAEESAGITIRGHLPEKDGILAGLLVAEMTAATGKSLRRLTEELFAKLGPVHDLRVALRLTSEMDAGFDAKIGNPPSRIDGKSVVQVDRTDGTKLLLEDGEWVLLRKSGTEPVVRLYAEASRPERLNGLIHACEHWLAS